MATNAHIESARGSPLQNRDYCTKDGDFVEHGVIPLTGGEAEKERWAAAYNAAREGRVDDIDPRILVQYYGNIKRILQDNPPPSVTLDGELEHLWFTVRLVWSKSRRARELAPNAYIKPCSKWWDGYRGEADVIIDDFEQNFGVLGHHMKIWADRYAFMAEQKGTSVSIRPKRIIVTSNYHPRDIWSEGQILSAILRRFKVTHIVSLRQPEAEPENLLQLSDLDLCSDYLGFLTE